MPQSIHQTGAGFEENEGFSSRILTKLNSLWVAATYPFAGKGRNIRFHFASDISRCLAPRIWLGNRVAIGRHAWLNFGEGANQELKITIEDDCRIAARCTITALNFIHLGRDVVLAPDVLVMDHNHAFEDVSRPIMVQGVTPGGRIRIGEGCRVGQGAAVLCNRGELVLGRNCVVAPGAIVTRSFPPDSVISGNPARAVQQAAQGREGQPIHEGDVAGMKESPLDRNPGPIGYPRQVAREDPLEWFSRVARKLCMLWLARTYPFASFGKGVWIYYPCHVTRSAARYISIGDDVGLHRDVRLDVSAAPGTDPPVLILEEGCGVGRRCVFSARNRIHVMRNSLFGPSVLVMDHGREVEQGTDPTGRRQETGGGAIRIEEECWIGYGAVIVCEQGELVIGRHSVVGANSVVRRSIPPYSVVVGDPARIVKQYDPSKRKWVSGCIRPAAGADRQDSDPAASALS